MKNRLHFALATLGLAASLTLPTSAADFIVPSGQTVIYDTLLGPLSVDNFIIQPNAILKVLGPNPFVLNAKQGIVIDGILDLSGFDRPDIPTLSTGDQPELGASGAAGGGAGGVGSFVTTTSTPFGGSGFGGFQIVALGGSGGEAGHGSAFGPKDNYRGAGGGGGALGPNLPQQALPGVVGITAQSGFDGGLGAKGVVFGFSPPQGGRPGPNLFLDSDPGNDFWGVKVNPVSGLVRIGELLRPSPGSGGGAGGDGVKSDVYPPISWTVGTDKKGCGGGGGGGLGLIKGRYILVGAGGQVLANGGSGGSGENVTSTDHIGGGSGGGSGGYLVLQGGIIDLSQAAPNCLSAVGGHGGKGKNGYASTGAGGEGGAGIIQLHTKTPGKVILPLGSSVADMSIPNAHLLLPIL